MNTKMKKLTQKGKSFEFCLSDDEILNPEDVFYSFCDNSNIREEINKLDRLLAMVSKLDCENIQPCYDLIDTNYRRLVEAVFLFTGIQAKEEVSVERFLGLFAHEIKTQISGASLAVESIMEKTESFFSSRPDLAFYLTTLRSILFNSSQILTNMISTVQFSENFFTLRTTAEVFKVDDFIEQCTVPYQLFNENFNKMLTVDLGELQGKMIRSDKVKLSQIIQNLLSNAYKHSKGREIMLTATVCSDKCVSFSITSQGHTIPTKELKQLLKMYYKASQSNAGYGIGLYLCELYAEHLFGNIKITSHKGVTTFTVCIPCEIRD